MEISEFTFRIILIFIPGFISFLIIEFLTIQKEETKLHKILIYSFVLGFLSYSLYYLVIWILNSLFKCGLTFYFLKTLTDKTEELNLPEIFVVTGIGFILGLIITWLIRNEILHYLMRKASLTNKHGDVDDWSFILNNTEIPNLVMIRDKNDDTIYYGWVQYFSPIRDVVEIFLVDVSIYKRHKDSLEEYKTPGLYLLKKGDDLVVQFPYLDFEVLRKRVKEGANVRKEKQSDKSKGVH